MSVWADIAEKAERAAAELEEAARGERVAEAIAERDDLLYVAGLAKAWMRAEVAA